MIGFLNRAQAWLVRTGHAFGTHFNQPAGLTRIVEIAGLTITARELTVLEVRKWLRELRSQKPFDVIDTFLFAEQGITVSDLIRMTNASKRTIESLPPSLLLELALAIKEMNPFFFRLRQRLESIAIAPERS
jgi:uncharacterized membrane protein (UPF0136 family)